MIRSYQSSARVGFIALSIVALFGTTAMAAEMVTLNPFEDTFSRAQAPTSTYGAAGALHISGESATNGNGQTQGVADSWMKYNLVAAIMQFDTAYGAGNWTITGATLSLKEVATPTNSIFTRGVGNFSVNWIANENWTEGAGSPNGPGTASGNQLGWTYGQSILSGADRSLGVFHNAGTNNRQDFTLALDTNFVSDLMAGGSTTLRTAPASNNVGFTFNSSNNPNSGNRPQLILTADVVPEPATLSMLLIVGFAVCRRRR